MPCHLPCACIALRRATRAVTAAYDAALAPVGLRVTQFSVLSTLARSGPLSVTRLAAEAELDRSTMGRNLAPLERDGLVRMEAGQDGRERVACLTERGQAVIVQATPHWARVQATISPLFEQADMEQLLATLARLGQPSTPSETA